MRYYRLLLIAGVPGSGKTRLLQACHREIGCPYLNLNLVLSQRLLEVRTGGRALQVQNLLEEVLTGSSLLLVDNIELLFDPILQLDPLRALKSASRYHSLVVAWPGAVEGGPLTHAEPGHSAYRRYDLHELADIIVVDVSTLLSEV
jgi:hypothetical protein